MTVVYALFVLRSTAGIMSNAVDYRSHDDAPECELFPRRRELAQLVPHHILRDDNRDVIPAVVNLEANAECTGDQPSATPGKTWRVCQCVVAERVTVVERHSPDKIRQDGA